MEKEAPPETGEEYDFTPHTQQIQQHLPPFKEATINLAIGQSCPVRCEGCYNHFGHTYKNGGLLSADEIIDFAAAAAHIGVRRATVSGGDPLSHPEILPILSGLKSHDLKVKLDTVGSTFLEEAPIVFKGRGAIRQMSMYKIKPYVDQVNIPLDGANQETVGRFRRGRPNLFAETRTVAWLLSKAGMPFGYNTVVSAANISQLRAIGEIAEADGAVEWQMFEYDPDGPNPSVKKAVLKLPPGVFKLKTQAFQSTKNLKINCKSLDQRSGAYFLVDDSGMAWQPAGAGLRHVSGHITRDRDVVMRALGEHIQSLREKSP